MSAFLLRDPNCVLIHIPKSAGTSIRKGLWKGNYDGPFFGELPKSLEPYFKFAFVRNPYDRLLSVWRMFAYGTSDTDAKNTGWHPDKNLSIMDILDFVTDDSIIYDERRQTFEEEIKHHALPMTHPFNAIESADFIGRYESLNDDWMHVASQIGWPEATLPYRNVSSKQAVKRQVDLGECEIKQIQEIYREDFERFSYSFHIEE